MLALRARLLILPSLIGVRLPISFAQQSVEGILVPSFGIGLVESVNLQPCANCSKPWVCSGASPVNLEESLLQVWAIQRLWLSGVSSSRSLPSLPSF